MNRLDKDDNYEGRLERTWQKMSIEGKREFETAYGHWSSLNTDQRSGSLSSYFSNLRQREEDERVRKYTEPYIKALHEITHLLDRKFGNLEGQLSQIGRTNEYLRGQVNKLENLAKEDRARKQISITSKTTGTSPQTNTYPIFPIKMDCVYKGDTGPKECIIIESTPEGRYGTCTVGAQVRMRQIGPKLFTTAFETTGCPSNRLVRPCEFYLNERVKLS